MSKRLYLLTAVIICFVLLLCACGSPAASPSGSSESSAAPKTSAAASVSASQAAASAAFQYYALVDIGMTKDEAEQKLGLTASEDTSGIVPEGQSGYYYTDDNGDGVYLLYDEDQKVYSKTVQYVDPAAALVPYTSKAVTEAECDQITDGMAHADVVALLGSEGAECSKTLSDIAGESELGTIYRWGNPDGSFLQVVFTSDDTAHTAMYFD